VKCRKERDGRCTEVDQVSGLMTLPFADRKKEDLHRFLLLPPPLDRIILIKFCASQKVRTSDRGIVFPSSDRGTGRRRGARRWVGDETINIRG